MRHIETLFKILVPVLLTTWVTLSCSNLEIARKRADNYYNLGQYVEATEKYSKVMEIEGASFGSLYSRAQCQAHLKNWDRACTDFEAAREINPDFPDTYEKLANCYGRMDKQAEVQKAWQTLLKINPKHPKANAALASIYFDQQRYSDAEARYQAYLEIRPDDVIVRSAMAAGMIAQDRPEAAVKELKRALADDPKCVLCHFNLGVAYLGAGRLEEAEREFIVVSAIEPAYQDGWVYLAATYCRLGEKLKAIETLAAAKNHGFYDWQRIAGDTDFESIIAHPRYMELTNGLGPKVRQPTSDGPSAVMDTPPVPEGEPPSEGPLPRRN